MCKIGTWLIRDNELILKFVEIDWEFPHTAQCLGTQGGVASLNAWNHLGIRFHVGGIIYAIQQQETYLSLKCMETADSNIKSTLIIRNYPNEITDVGGK